MAPARQSIFGQEITGMNLWVGTCPPMGVCHELDEPHKPHPESLWVKPHPLQQKPPWTVSAAPLAGQLPADWTDVSPASTLSRRVHEPLTGTDMQRTLRAELLCLTADRVNFFLLDGFLKHY